MDEHGPLPLNLQALEERLRAGQTYQITNHAGDGFSYQISFDADRFVLQQGASTHRFHNIGTAILTLLNCLGEFVAPEPS